MEKNKQSKFRRMMLIVLVLFITSCTSPKDKELPNLLIGDGGVLSGYPCSAPCFWNITPGVTSEKEALSILSSLGDIQNCEKWGKVENGADKGVRCNNFAYTANTDGLINHLSFSPTVNIEIVDAISLFGNPDQVSVTAEGIESEGPVTLLLFFNEEQMIFEFQSQDTQTIYLEPTTEIPSIQYCDDDMYSMYTNIRTEPWKGYGEY